MFTFGSIIYKQSTEQDVNLNDAVVDRLRKSKNEKS